MNEQFSKTVLHGNAITSRVLEAKINKLTKKLIKKSKTNSIVHNEDGALEIWNKEIRRDELLNVKSDKLNKSKSSIKHVIEMKVLSGTSLPNSVFRKKIQNEIAIEENPNTVESYVKRLESMEELLNKGDEIISKYEDEKRKEIIRLSLGPGILPLTSYKY